MAGFLFSSLAMIRAMLLAYIAGSTPMPAKPPTPSKTPISDTLPTFMLIRTSSPPLYALMGCGRHAHALSKPGWVRSRARTGGLFAKAAPTQPCGVFGTDCSTCLEVGGRGGRHHLLGRASGTRFPGERAFGCFAGFRPNSVSAYHEEGGAQSAHASPPLDHHQDTSLSPTHAGESPHLGVRAAGTSSSRMWWAQRKPPPLPWHSRGTEECSQAPPVNQLHLSSCVGVAEACPVAKGMRIQETGLQQHGAQSKRGVGDALVGVQPQLNQDGRESSSQKYEAFRLHVGRGH
eukprot:CAMPEP_0174917610 /NCGR_PEP_ID=MMETSP1355-20121228/2572_1 /TAXON_ID=464990 /ORGANISM="Hemiselmis tepida, Strain CCMP443" /LENGTH=289 /DNA_ID=CAMNT_0016162721 /DNA_START=154 /DNA_END=1021 /DNA_ORIENTATION=-